MESILEFYHLITNPEVIIKTGGLFLILLIIFAENGVFFGFFLPGDTLLFTTGLLCSTDTFDVPITTLLVISLEKKQEANFLQKTILYSLKRNTCLLQKHFLSVTVQLH
jgi:membrane protein DedA with SNARE-associated domain